MSKRQEIINQKKDILVDIDNDFFSYDAPMNYKNILAEIGQDDASNFHFTGKGNNTDIPPTSDNSATRIYRVYETREVVTVALSFDMSDFGVNDGSD